MDKKKIFSIGGPVLTAMVGTVLGLLAFEYGKRKFVKADFTKPLEVKKEE